MTKMLVLIAIAIAITKSSPICCYYRQHYHDAYCGGCNNSDTSDPGNNSDSSSNNSDFSSDNTKSFGCIITRALVVGSPMIICSHNNRCMPPESDQGYWLEGFEMNCDRCSDNGFV